MIFGQLMLVFWKGLVSLTCNYTAKESCIPVVNFCIRHQASCFVFCIMLNMVLLLRVVNEGEHVIVNRVAKEVSPSVEVGSNTCGTSQESDWTFPSTKASPGCIQPYLVLYKLISLLLLFTASSD